MKKVVFVFLFIFTSSFLFAKKNDTQIKLANIKSIYLDKNTIYDSQEFALYDAWLKLEDALKNSTDEQFVLECQKEFNLCLENEKKGESYALVGNMLGIEQLLEEMKIACENKDSQELSRLIVAFYVSKGLISQKSDSISVQLLVFMGVLILAIMALLFFYQFTYARRIEIEKILKATNKGQEEERRRIALELHDSVAQQMRYVSLLAEKIQDEHLSKEIKMNQSECIENLRNTCYTLSSIDMNQSNFPEILKNAVNSFQNRTGIATSLVITPEVDFNILPQITFNHIFRVIMELLINIEKHSEAHEVTLLIRNPVASDKMEEGLMIFLSDDGKGIDSEILEMMNSKKIINIKNMHFGLQNIKLRLNEINGSIKYISEKDEGTEVEIRIKK